MKRLEPQQTLGLRLVAEKGLDAYNSNMSNWSDDTKRAVWNNCKEVPGKLSCEYRYDENGAIMKWSEYGKYTDKGWQIDHIYPEAILQDLGVDQEKIDNILNLRALNSYNNDTKSDEYPSFKSSKTYDAQKDKNIDKEQSWSITPEKQAQLKKYFGLR